jgi:hypothetical protein
VNRLLLFSALAVSAFGYTGSSPTFTTDGTVSDVQAAIDAAVDGDTVIIPPGDHSWASGVTVSGKGIHIQGGGSGRVIARSVGEQTVSTGAKTFTLNAIGLPITANQTLWITRTGGEQAGAPLYNGSTGMLPTMIGTVDSYSGTTLVMDIDTATDAGTYVHPIWIIATTATTTITRSGSNTVFLDVAEDASHTVEISGIRFDYGSGTGNTIAISSVSGGKPVQIHDCFFEAVYTGGAYSFNVKGQSQRGMIYDCSFIGAPFSNAGQPIQVSATGVDAWATTSTMGAADTTGLNNFYIEDCDFHGIQNATDMSDSARAVVRHCLINNAGLGTHGPDTGTYGLRHYEIYDNEFVFNGFNNAQTLPLDYLIYFRGGTGLVYNNTIPDLDSTDFPGKNDVNLQIQMLDRNAGPNALWSDNDGQVPEYPCPRQVGMGRVTGTGLDGQGRSVDSITYVGDVEPLYIWGNSRTPDYAVTGAGAGEGLDPDLPGDYIQAGRDFFINGTAKPGWTAYTYPHPLRTDASASDNPRHTPRNARGLGVSRRR